MTREVFVRHRRKALIVILCAVFLANIAGQKKQPPPADHDGYTHLQVYSEVLYHIRAEYVEEPNIPLVTSGALHGLLESFDANSSYLSPAEYRAYKQGHATGNANIGATVSKRFGYAAVVSVIPGGPAEKAGIESGDIIELFDGKSTHDMSLAEIRSRLSGAPGSRLEFSIIKVRKIEPQKIQVVRDVIAVPVVQQRMLANNTGYVHAITLDKGKAQEMATAIKSLQKQGATRLVLDLRDCSAGEEEEGVAAVNLFLSHGLIGYLEGQTFSRTTFQADPQKTITNLPLVVLVNRGTAGAAELAASAILDNGRGDVLGDKTFGDGSVQKVIELSDGGAMVLSIAKYYSAKGRVIQDNGVAPNVEVASADDTTVVADDDDSGAATQSSHRKPGPDAQLQKALEILAKKPLPAGGAR